VWNWWPTKRRKHRRPAKGVAQKLAVSPRKLPDRAATAVGSFRHLPAAVISEAEIGELFDRLERALAKTLDWQAEKLI